MRARIDELIKNRYKPVLLIPHYSNRFIPDEDYREIFKTLRYYLDQGIFQHGMKIEEYITPEQKKNKQKRDLFAEFVRLLNVLKRKGVISSKQWREYSIQWNDSPHLQDELMQRIKLMIKSID